MKTATNGGHWKCRVLCFRKEILCSSLPHGKVTFPGLTISPLSTLRNFRNKDWLAALWMYCHLVHFSLKVTWNSHDFLTKCHNMFKPIPGKSQSNFLQPHADVSLSIGMLVYENDVDLCTNWQVSHYRRILSSSHKHITHSHMCSHGNRDKHLTLFLWYKMDFVL